MCSELTVNQIARITGYIKGYILVTNNSLHLLHRIFQMRGIAIGVSVIHGVFDEQLQY